VKQILRKGIGAPNLYYESESDFAFFARPDLSLLRDLYSGQGQGYSSDLAERIRFSRSKAMRSSALFMLDWIRESLPNDSLFNQSPKSLKCIDFGAGSGWFSLALRECLGSVVHAVDFSLDAMSHLGIVDDSIGLVGLDDFFARELSFDCFFLLTLSNTWLIPWLP